MSVVDRIRSSLMNRFQLTDDIIHKGTITISETSTLTADLNQPSVLKPVYVTVQSIDDFKEFGGIPDDLYASGAVQEHHYFPPEWPTDKMKRLEELSLRERIMICKAYQAYIFGNSQKVQSYKEIIQNLFFPAQVALFSGENLYVKTGETLTIESPSPDVPVVLSFTKVTVEAGGRIINTCPVTWLINTFEQQGAIPTYNLVCKGVDGKPGADNKSNPGQSPQGNKGNDGEDNGKHCGIQPQNGHPGQPGYTGGTGGNGGSGGDAPSGKITVDTIIGPVILGSIGGNGGDGGKGGDGGQGGDGGLPGSNTKHCQKQAYRGVGGKGGNGGPGGNGGDGGNGNEIYFNYTTLESGNIWVCQPKDQCQGGKGGSPGQPGKGGVGPESGGGGETGQVGTNGENGKYGSVYINYVPTPANTEKCELETNN